MGKIGRNDACPCGSGLKYKCCCLSSSRPEAPATQQPSGAFKPSDPRNLISGPAFDSVDQLAEARGLRPLEPDAPERRALQLLLDLRAEYERRLDPDSDIQDDPSWGLAYEALHRAYDLTVGSVLAHVASPVAGEVAARGAVEASVNVQYCLTGKRAERFRAYFRSYLKAEAKQNERWRTALDGLPPEELADHLERIDSKDALLERLDKIVEESFASMGVPPQPSPNWPNVFERFRSLGLELEYRTVYAALSSQAHNDAEDLLNTWAIHCMAAPIPGLSATFHDLRRQEKRAFSWFCVTI